MKGILQSEKQRHAKSDIIGITYLEPTKSITGSSISIYSTVMLLGVYLA